MVLQPLDETMRIKGCKAGNLQLHSGLELLTSLPAVLILVIAHAMLPTLYDWSISHIQNVFEAKSEDECLRAIDHTFSRGIEFIANGKQLNRTELQRFILSMAMSSGFRLKVQWQNALEVPRDESNRVSRRWF